MTLIAAISHQLPRHFNVKSLMAPQYCSALLLSTFFYISPAFAQDVLSDALFGERSLDAGFAPDPVRIDIIAGGSTDASNSDANCAGFITAEQPDYRFHYSPDNYALGLFVASDVDTTLIINTPDGSWECNDDFSALENNNPGVVFSEPLAGQYDIWVGTYDTFDEGAQAELFITEQSQNQWLSLLNEPANGVNAVSEDSETIAMNTQAQGRLNSGDNTLENYGYADNYSFTGSAGQNAIIDLSSEQFDTYLILRTPSGAEYSNDDFEGSTARSLLSLPLAESGQFEIIVSSFMSGETGPYSLSLSVDDSSAEAAIRTETGELTSTDAQLESGEYIDIYEFSGRPGQRLQADLRSLDFDTFLILISPSGEQFENDDADSISRSFLDMTLSESGNYQIVVTSFELGSVGEYSLTIDQSGIEDNPPRNSNISSLAIGETIEGQLSAAQSANVNNKLENTYWFAGQIDDTVRIDLHSSDFDTFLRLLTPSGELIENDDFEGSLNNSSISLTLRETGRYRVVVTSYDAGDTGTYDLGLQAQQNPIITPSSTGQIYGIFAGISDYPGSDQDLMFTDEDAIRAREALISGAGMPEENGILLLNSQATLESFRAAIEEIADKATEQDTVVLFYSGHGSRVIRPAGPNSADPDGLDETIELYDGAMLDDELALLFDTVNAGTTLLVLDSCFSGGFAKDLVSRPGRMGLFSSEEDVTSQVAAKFRAGGYLSVFFEEAMNGYADLDDNGELTAIELSEYLHDRFRNDVKSTGLDQYVRTSGPQSGYQHLVVDRGGVGPYNILFNH